MPDPGRKEVEALYDAFNRRDAEALIELCDPEMAFFPIVTAEAVGREAPYTGPAGLREYLTDIAVVWDVLEISAGEVEQRDGLLLVRGRVYARSRELGIRDVPFAWLWELRDGRFVRGEVFPDPEEAAARFAAAAANAV